MDVFRSMELQRGLAKAIIENQFSLIYQPKYNSAKICVGYETLLRWNHPTWGMVSPGEFILLAEETKQIIPIGEWVIKRVCQQIQEWREDGRTLLPV
ncbi:EAL domain-containing protein [Metabacillus idriensis]|uniref:EAL domain-containing protein n=1 Tax=Metabacillus idriensis TaxID=324768 RepID=UPI00398FE168